MKFDIALSLGNFICARWSSSQSANLSQAMCLLEKYCCFKSKNFKHISIISIKSIPIEYSLVCVIWDIIDSKSVSA